MALAKDARQEAKIVPPEGFPFIVLPALDIQPEPEPSPPPRRRLAVNVIALFEEERPEVQNIKRRGRYPRNVISFYDRPRLRAGVIAELCGGAHPDNLGKKVRILGRHFDADVPTGMWWNIEAVSTPLTLTDAASGKTSGRQGMSGIARDENLRRLWRLPLKR